MPVKKSRITTYPLEALTGPSMMDEAAYLRALIDQISGIPDFLRGAWDEAAAIAFPAH
jgi:hypothetical protein